MKIVAARHRVRKDEPTRRASGCAVATLVGVAWGSLAFGAVYPWAYWPLLVVCGVAGLLGIVRPGKSASLNRPLAYGCVLLMSAVLIQLVPLSRGVVSAISPHTVVLAGERRIAELSDAEILAGAPATDGRHPLSLNPRETWRGLVLLATFALFLVGTSCIVDHHDLRRIVRGILALGVALALAGITQKAAYNGKIYGFWAPYYEVFPFGPFMNRDHFAGWMVMAIPLGVGYLGGELARSLSGVGTSLRDRLMWLSSPKANQLMLTALGIAVMALSLVLTLSRSGIIAFIVALSVIASVIARSQTGRRHRLLPMLFLLSTVALSLGWAGTDTVIDRFADASTLNFSGRTAIWYETVQIIRQFPLVGTGLNTFATAMTFYRKSSDLVAVQAHSDYLQLAAEGGLLLGGAAAILLMVFVREVRRRFRESAGRPTDYWIRVGVVAGLIAIGVQELAEFSLQIPGNAALFVVLCALAVRRSSTPTSR